MGGSLPKRSDQRVGHPKGTAEATATEKLPNSTDELMGPEAPEWLDGFAREIYDSVRMSGQSVYYTEGDWSVLAMLCRGAMEFIRRPSAMMLSSIMSGFNDLAMTEGSRRRVKLELGKATGVDDPDAERADNTSMSWYKKLEERNRKQQGILDDDDPDIARE